MSSRIWQHRIQDILDAITEIQSFVADATFEQFTTDAKTLKAVAADLMIIGEAPITFPTTFRKPMEKCHGRSCER